MNSQLAYRLIGYIGLLNKVAEQIIFLIRFAQRPGALKEFVNHVLGPNDDITRFEYMQKHNKETGPALVGIELQSRDDYELLLQKLNAHHINFRELNKEDDLFGYLV